jgi:hypothetical protein
MKDTVKLYLSGLVGTVCHPNMQKIRIIGFFFENRLHWQFEVGKKFLQTIVLGYIFVLVQMKRKYTTPYMYLTVGEKI